METEKIESQLQEIQARNKRVEADKAWETSWIRRIYIAVATYVFALLWLTMISVDKPGLNALVPTVAYILSTVSLSSIKKRWIRKRLQ
jgi:hypothetical protein